MVREVLSVFQSDTAVRIRNVAAALAQGDAARVRSEAHAVKGSAAQVGALEVSDLSRKIEAAALRLDLAEAARLMPELETAFSSLSAEMSDSGRSGL